MNHDYYSLADVAKILRCPPYRIVYLLTTGQVPEPYRVGNKRLFSIEDLSRLSEKLQTELAQDLLARKEGGHHGTN